jgi:hypothetical protein
MQRRIVWFLALFLVVALQSIIHVREEQQYDGFLGPSGTVVLHAMAQSQNETFDKFGFYVMGDTPYADWEEHDARATNRRAPQESAGSYTVYRSCGRHSKSPTNELRGIALPTHGQCLEGGTSPDLGHSGRQ